MTRGIITTRHILSHPLILIGGFGLGKYLHMLAASLDSREHFFIDLCCSDKKHGEKRQQKVEKGSAGNVKRDVS